MPISISKAEHDQRHNRYTQRTGHPVIFGRSWIVGKTAAIERNGKHGDAVLLGQQLERGRQAMAVRAIRAEDEEQAPFLRQRRQRVCLAPVALTVAHLDGRVVRRITQLIVDFGIGPDHSPPYIRKQRCPVHQGFLSNDVGLQVFRSRLEDGDRPFLLDLLAQLLERINGSFAFALCAVWSLLWTGFGGFLFRQIAIPVKPGFIALPGGRIVQRLTRLGA